MDCVRQRVSRCYRLLDHAKRSVSAGTQRALGRRERQQVVSQHQLDRQQIFKQPQRGISLPYGKRSGGLVVLDTKIQRGYVQRGRCGAIPLSRTASAAGTWSVGSDGPMPPLWDMTRNICSPRISSSVSRVSLPWPTCVVRP
jgi:hypothetical protein